MHGDVVSLRLSALKWTLPDSDTYETGCTYFRGAIGQEYRGPLTDIVCRLTARMNNKSIFCHVHSSRD